MTGQHKPEEIITKLHQLNVLVSQDSNVADAVRSIAVTEVTHYRWRQEYGGLRWLRLSEQRASLRRVVPCRVQAAAVCGSLSK